MLYYSFLPSDWQVPIDRGGNDLDQAGEEEPVADNALSVGNDLALFLERPSPQSCQQCDLSDSDLTGADLTGANLTEADLAGVIGADFTGALNVPAKYR